MLLGVLVIALTAFAEKSVAEPSLSAKQSEIRHVALDEHISLDIYAPQGMHAQRAFPVLYVMDGQYYTYNAIGFQKSLNKRLSISPDYIVVGINTEKLVESDSRAAWLESEPQRMIQYLEKQIIPYVDGHYPTTSRRLYFGWQYGAIFGLKLFNANPTLFQGYMLASGQRYSDAMLEQTAGVLQTHPGLGSYFYLTLGKSERHTLQGHTRLTGLFEQYKEAGITWHYSYLDRFSPQIDHHTTPLESLTDGLAWHFSDYPDLTFNSLAEVEQFGGIEAVKAYYRQRAKRYQVSAEVGEQARFSMFRWAAEENNWAYFQRLEQELGRFEVSAWYGFFGNFFAANNQLERAQKVFQRATRERPADHRYWGALAGVYDRLGKHAEAADSYQKALEKTQATDPAYATYAGEVKRLKGLK